MKELTSIEIESIEGAGLIGFITDAMAVGSGAIVGLTLVQQLTTGHNYSLLGLFPVPNFVITMGGGILGATIADGLIHWRNNQHQKDYWG